MSCGAPIRNSPVQPHGVAIAFSVRRMFPRNRPITLRQRAIRLLDLVSVVGLLFENAVLVIKLRIPSYSCATPVLFRDSHLVKVCDLGIAGLNLPLSVLDFVSLHQPTRGHSLVDGSGASAFFHLRRETTTRASGRQGSRL